MPPPGPLLGVIGIRAARPATATSVAVSANVLVMRVLDVRVGRAETVGIAMSAPEPVLVRLGATLQPPPALVATHRDKGRFDEGYRVVRVGRVIGP
ncbi:hypothetical protein [Agromyces sp. ISL-38]|uniref:hypothetical protein n=1 Tax=Agromyces sp. ISL-38 TaxID=2819107 RepID=UPI001BED2E8A|nr:hypothetical protein [Agromyces sp. ISL-38]MBT2517295.1 hypothetical protein [Streptomyces sp. ISL-90]